MKIRYIFIHHSAYPREHHPEQFIKIDLLHKQRFNFKSSLGFYVGYTYLIEPDGRVKQAREEGEEQAAQKGYNTETISICLGLHGDTELPSLAQKSALKGLIERLMADYKLTFNDIKLHRDVGSTSCPGRLITRGYMLQLINDQSYRVNLIKALIKATRRLLELLKSRKIK